MRFLRLRRIHFVGAGGVGMSGLAEILLLSTPLEISGCDRERSENTERLTALGARIAYGHDESHLEQADLVVISSAISEGNPEVGAARRARDSRHSPGRDARRDHAVEAGRRGGRDAREDDDDLADRHGPDRGRVRSDDRRRRARAHPRHQRAARQGGLPRRGGGRVRPLLPGADAGRRGHHQHRGGPPRHLPRPRRHPRRVRHVRQPRAVLRRGRRVRGRRRRAEDPSAHQAARRDLRREPGGGPSRRRGSGWKPPGRPSRSGRGRRWSLGEVRLPLPGRHNVANALAAIAVGPGALDPFPTIARALKEFTGVVRRFETKGERGGVLVVDDYAHHPTEIAATLAAARQVYPGRRLVALFQPHLFSRTRDFAAGSSGRRSPAPTSRS